MTFSNFQTEYYLKWLGYSESENSWVVQEDTNCDDLIMAYEQAQLGNVEGNQMKTKRFLKYCLIESILCFVFQANLFR